MGGGDSDTPQALAAVNYGSAVEYLSIPTKLASISALPEPQTVRSFELNHGMSPSAGMAFLIDGLMAKFIITIALTSKQNSTLQKIGKLLIQE